MKYPFLLPVAFLLLILSPLHSQTQWRHLTTDDGLTSNIIYSLYQANNGHIWIGTEQGIHRYNGVFDEVSLYGLVDSILESPSGQILARQVVSSNNISAVKINFFDGLK